jgi:hypothetical protein
VVGAAPRSRAAAVVFGLVYGLVLFGLIVPLSIHRLARNDDHPAPAPTPVAAVRDAPAGQTTRVGLLPGAQAAFPHGPAGWTATGARLGWSGTDGRGQPGALRVQWGSAPAALRSPTFAVTPGDRYWAHAWIHSATAGHAVAIGLRFFDAAGRPMVSGTQVAQPAPAAPTGWTRTTTVIGFAPDRAARGVVVVSSAGAVGTTELVDDVVVGRTSGVAAPVVGPLSTRGPDILDAHGRRVVLRGIQLGGLKNPTWADTTISTDEVEAAHSWGANFARIPLAENPLLPGDCSHDPAYLRIVDRVVTDLTSRGMVALLDLHSLALAPCGTYTQQLMPDASAIAFWRLLAGRYKDNPLVAFDLYNEPHGVPDSVWRDGGVVVSNGVSYATPGMQRLYDVVRAAGADNLVFASGNGWAKRFPVDAPLEHTANLVYAAHAYTCPQGLPAQGARCDPGPHGLFDPTGALAGFLDAGQTAPVVVTEFGWPDAQDSRFVRAVIDYVDRHHWAGWDVFVFDGGTESLFSLVKSIDSVWQPAPSGMAAMVGMLGD